MIKMLELISYFFESIVVDFLSLNCPSGGVHAQVTLTGS